MKDIIEQNRGLIKAIIKKLTGSYNEDIEQEVYIKTWRNMDHYKEQGKFSQWIGALTANVCRDYFKSRQYKIEAGQVGPFEFARAFGAAAAHQHLAGRAVSLGERALGQLVLNEVVEGECHQATSENSAVRPPVVLAPAKATSDRPR